MSQAESSEHRLLRQGLPDWLADVPMDAQKPIWIPVGQDKSVPLTTLMSGLQIEVGSSVGRMAIAPELAKLFSEFTEKPGWENLPTEPTWVQRVEENEWEVRVGDYSGRFSREELVQRIKETLDKSPKDQV